MANITVNIDGAQAAQDMRKAFGGLSDKQFKRGVSLALNTAALRVRTITAREIRSMYNIRYSYLTKKLMPISKAHAGKLVSTISLSTRPIPVGELTRNAPNKKGVRVSVIKGQSKLIKGAFLFRSKYSHTGRPSIMHRSNVEGNTSYNNNAFQFRHKRIQKGSDLTIGAIFTVSPLHSIFNEVLNRNITNAGREILAREMTSKLTAMRDGLIKDARRFRR